MLFDDSYLFSRYFEDAKKEENIDDSFRPSEISVSTALEVVRIVCSVSDYKLCNMGPDCEGGVLVVFDKGFIIQISNKGSIFPSKNNEACSFYCTLEQLKTDPLKFIL